MQESGQSSAPRPSLSVFDAVVVLVGLVVGIGIFRTPSLVAANVDSGFAFIAVWVVGGIVTLAGALCYAELAAARPSAGGEYQFISHAYGRNAAVLFGWARGSVIQTGAIAGVGFVLGDYANQLVSLGPYGPALYAALAIVIFTGINVIGTLQSKWLQIAVTILEIAIILAIVAVGLASSGAPAPAPVTTSPAGAALGLAMIFVLLTYGGWNEVSYLSAELKDAPRNIAKVLVVGTLILIVIYVSVNAALLSVLGLEGLRASGTVAADMMGRTIGPAGAAIVSAGIVVAAISTLNATIFTGARVYYAMAQDLTLLPSVGRWNSRGANPANGLLLQAAVALTLVAIGAATRDGFKAMVDYTAPVFWGFLLLVGASVFILRWRDPDRPLPFRVPLYPLTPLVFCGACVFMLHASIAYTGAAALVGLAVLFAGLPLLAFRRSLDAEPAAAAGPRQPS